jgi:hypothetical protein
MSFSRKLNAVYDLRSLQVTIKRCLSQKLKKSSKSKTTENTVEQQDDSVSEWFDQMKHGARSHKECVKFSELSESEKKEEIKKIWRDRLAQFKSAPKELDQKALSLLLKRESYNQLCKSFEYLAKSEYYKEKDEKQRAFSKKMREQIKSGEIEKPYSSTFLRRIGASDTRFFYRHRLLSAIMDNAPTIVFDHRFTAIQTRDEALVTMYRQFIEVLHYNREQSLSPFQVYSFLFLN